MQFRIAIGGLFVGKFSCIVSKNLYHMIAHLSPLSDVYNIIISYKKY